MAAGDLSAEPAGDFRHEIAALKADTTAMVAGLRQSVEESRARTEEAHQATAEAHRALEEAKSQGTKVHGLLSSISEAAGRAGDISKRVFAAIKELTSQVDKVNSGVEVQRDRMTETRHRHGGDELHRAGGGEKRRRRRGQRGESKEYATTERPGCAGRWTPSCTSKSASSSSRRP